MSPDQISELVWDIASDQDTATSSETTSEDEGGLQDVPGVTHLHGIYSKWKTLFTLHHARGIRTLKN